MWHSVFKKIPCVWPAAVSFQYELKISPLYKNCKACSSWSVAPRRPPLTALVLFRLGNEICCNSGWKAALISSFYLYHYWFSALAWGAELDGFCFVFLGFNNVSELWNPLCLDGYHRTASIMTFPPSVCFIYKMNPPRRPSPPLCWNLHLYMAACINHVYMYGTRR